MKQQEILVKFISELQTRVIKSLVVFLVFSGLGFLFSESIIRIVIKLVNLDGVNIVFTSPFQFIELSFSTSFFVGAFITTPFVFYQLLNFCSPALRDQEVRFIKSRLPVSIVLFAGGFAAGLFIMRYVMGLFFEKSLALEIGNVLDVSNLLSQILMTSTLMGLAFQLPILINLLIEFSVFSIEFFEKKRKIAYLLSLIFAALLPPTDLLSLVLLTVPIALLYEGSLIWYRLSNARRKS